jgi:hypothetical protein
MSSLSTEQPTGAQTAVKSVMLWLSFCNPMQVFNTHRGSDSEDSGARAVQSLFDELNLVHLNDGTFTRIATPPRRSSAIDFNLCTAGLALGDFEWTVLEYAGGSDYLLITTFFKSLNVPTNLPIPIFDPSRHISWSVYANAMLDS